MVKCLFHISIFLYKPQYNPYFRTFPLHKSMYLHILSWRIGAELVRRMGIDHSGNGVHHDRLFNKICKDINTVSQLLSCKLTYTLVGDYYIPNIALPEENRPIGRWGRLHRGYLEKHHPLLFNDLVLSGQLWTYLADLNEQAQERLFLIVEQMKAAEGVSEELKAANQMAWVGAMNSIRNRAEEIILREMIYGEDAL